MREAITSIRHFNRYYTNRLGLLSRYRLDTQFTLTEARVLLEIGRRGIHTHGALKSDLFLDPGYLSRIIKRLVVQGFVIPGRDETDGRVLNLELSDKGRKAVETIDRASNLDIEAMVAGLEKDAVKALVNHLREAEKILERRGERTPTIVSVSGGSVLATVRVLMREYASFLGADLSFQHFQEELDGLPGKYSSPGGALFLASITSVQGGEEPAGCVAIRRMDEDTCEMKRLFVRPEYRGAGVGKALAQRAIQVGKDLGYHYMRLDTLKRLDEAVSLYRSLGFVSIEAYYENPLPGAMFWELTL